MQNVNYRETSYGEMIREKVYGSSALSAQIFCKYNMVQNTSNFKKTVLLHDNVILVYKILISAHLSIFSVMFNIILLVYFWLCCVFVAVWTFSSCSEPALLLLGVLRLLTVVMPSCSKQGL